MPHAATSPFGRPLLLPAAGRWHPLWLVGESEASSCSKDNSRPVGSSECESRRRVPRGDGLCPLLPPEEGTGPPPPPASRPGDDSAPLKPPKEAKLSSQHSRKAEVSPSQRRQKSRRSAGLSATSPSTGGRKSEWAPLPHPRLPAPHDYLAALNPGSLSILFPSRN